MTDVVVPQRKIIHIDMDAFFASVEMRDEPSYRNIPLAVGGSERQRGVISTCNYEARQYGIHSAMSTAWAKKLCPHLTVVRGRMQVYREVSQQVRAIFARYTDLIEPLSLDEAYLDVTECQQLHGSATLIAQAIREDIRNELNLTASAGVAPIKFLAKIASDMNKPDGQFVITPSTQQSFIDSLPLGKIPGVGKVSLQKLQNAGFYVGEDIRKTDYLELTRKFGRLGHSLWHRSHGVDNREVTPHRQRKSVGVERTFATNISTFDECWQIIEHKLFPELYQRLGKASPDYAITKQGIKVKFADFQQTTIEHVHGRLDLPYFRELLQEVLTRQNGREIRLLGLSVMLKSEQELMQLPLDLSE